MNGAVFDHFRYFSGIRLIGLFQLSPNVVILVKGIGDMLNHVTVMLDFIVG